MSSGPPFAYPADLPCRVPLALHDMEVHFPAAAIPTIRDRIVYIHTGLTEAMKQIGEILLLTVDTSVAESDTAFPCHWCTLEHKHYHVHDVSLLIAAMEEHEKRHGKLLPEVREAVQEVANLSSLPRYDAEEECLKPRYDGSYLVSKKPGNKRGAIDEAGLCNVKQHLKKTIRRMDGECLFRLIASRLRTLISHPHPLEIVRNDFRSNILASYYLAGSGMTTEDVKANRPRPTHLVETIGRSWETVCELSLSALRLATPCVAEDCSNAAVANAAGDWVQPLTPFAFAHNGVFKDGRNPVVKRSSPGECQGCIGGVSLHALCQAGDCRTTIAWLTALDQHGRAIRHCYEHLQHFTFEETRDKTIHSINALLDDINEKARPDNQRAGCMLLEGIRRIAGQDSTDAKKPKVHKFRALQAVLEERLRDREDIREWLFH